MAYTALYRKFRPITFSEMVGQEHITKTLKNQIIAGRVGHAYLFNGGRGTGKTSAAKVLARTVNCLNPKDGEPCNECEICKAALAGSLTDIVEMDAASNNSVEDIRQIRDEVNFLPTLAKYRVYIIDEVHMLSTGAFNALLKTLEEPPEHVKFILATTEPQKLPATILSRCQRFDFKKISNEDIEKRLQIVCNQSNIEITPGAMRIISSLSEGAMRDALSILERCLQDGEIKIDEEKVRDLVGIPKLTYVHNVVSSIIKYDITSAIEATNNVINEGKDIQNLLWETIKYVKDILVYKTCKQLQIYNEEELKQIEELSNQVEAERLLQIIYELSELENDMKWSTQKSLLFQVGIIKLGTKRNELQEERKTSDYASEPKISNQDRNIINTLSKKIELLEQKLSYIMQNGIAVSTRTSQNVENKPQKTVKTENKSLQSQTVKINLKENEKLEAWSQILQDFKQTGKIMLYTNLINTKAYIINDMTVGIEFINGMTPFVKGIMEKPETIKELEERISVQCGKPMRVKFIDSKKEVQKEEIDPLQELAKDMELPINIIE